jgi:hypothetical protein
MSEERRPLLIQQQFPHRASSQLVDIQQPGRVEESPIIVSRDNYNTLSLNVEASSSSIGKLELVIS